MRGDMANERSEAAPQVGLRANSLATDAFIPRQASKSPGQAIYLALAFVPLAVLAVFYLYPLSRVIIISISEPQIGLDNYVRVFSSSVVRLILWTTLWVCTTTTVISLVLGYLLAYGILHAPARWQRWMLVAVLLSFWVSILIRAFSWLTLLQTRGVINEALLAVGIIDSPLQLIRNHLGVVIGMVHYLLPMAVLPLLANMRGIDGSFVRAARSLGASPLYAFRKVYFPLTAPGLISAGILVFIFSLGFYITPALLGGGRVTMLAEYIALQIQQTLAWGQGTALATLILFTVLGLLVLLARVAGFQKLFGAR